MTAFAMRRANSATGAYFLLPCYHLAANVENDAVRGSSQHPAGGSLGCGIIWTAS